MLLSNVFLISSALFPWVLCSDPVPGVLEAAAGPSGVWVGPCGLWGGTAAATDQARVWVEMHRPQTQPHYAGTCKHHGVIIKHMILHQHHLLVMKLTFFLNIHKPHSNQNHKLPLNSEGNSLSYLSNKIQMTWNLMKGQVKFKEFLLVCLGYLRNRQWKKLVVELRSFWLTGRR